MKWFRFYYEVIDDSKVAMMSDKTFRIWVLAMCNAGELDRDGNVPVTDKELAWRIRESEEVVSGAIQQLEELDIIETKNGRRRFRNWQKRQWKSDDSRDRVKRFRNGHVTVTVTPPDTDTDTDTESKRLSGRTTTPKKDFISSLKENPAFKHIDIDNELHKMDAWLLIPRNKGRKKTSRFILNWLSKIERPMQIGDGKSW